MGIFLFILLIVVALLIAYPILDNARENAIARRLEKIHNPNIASAEIDALIVQSKADTELLERFGRRPF